MGQGKRWSSEESAHLAEAWIHASEGVGEVKVKGASQDGNEFWGKVLEEFGRKAPANAAPGTYLKRENKGGETRPPIENHFRDKIQRDCKKFNSSLRKVLCSNPTGCSEQERINMAVAIHLGKSDSMSYRHKGFEPNDWLFYQAWLVLKSHRAFLPPTPPPPDEDIEEIEDDEDSDPPSDTAQALFTTPKVATASDTSDDSDMQPSKQRSRGPGYGVKKRKALKKQEEYRAKKYKTQQEFLEIQRQRRDNFRVYVDNKSRHDAFKMAVMGYNAFKDHDPEQGEYYKQQMERILGNAVPDDTVIEYRAKRHKTQQEFLEIQRQRSDNFRVYVDNKSRHDAFKMAVMGYNALKDHDPEQGEYYKQQMEHILGNAVPDDTVIEYRAKKHKTQQEFLEIQRQRSDNFRVYVDNKSRHNAFKMAVMGYNAFKDHDPEQAEYYKRQMERILGNAVPDDTVNGTDDASGDISD